MEAKYGRQLQAAFAEPGGEALRDWIDDMPNEQYQSLFGLSGGQLRERFLDGAPPARGAEVLSDVPDDRSWPRWSPTSAATTWPACSPRYAACDAVRRPARA